MHHYIIFVCAKGGKASVARNLLRLPHTRINSRLVDMQNGWAKYNENNLFALPSLLAREAFALKRYITAAKLLLAPHSAHLAKFACSTSSEAPPRASEIKGISFNDLSQSSDRMTRAIKRRQSLSVC
jgi:hypothetical protein